MQTASRNQPATAIAVTLRQLAELCQVDQCQVSRAHLELPEGIPLRDGTVSRPQLCIPIESLIEWALRRTEGLTDVECRLRLAAMNEQKRKPAQRMSGPYSMVPSDDGHFVLVDRLEDLSPAELGRYRKQRAEKHDAVQMSRLRKAR